MSKRLLSFALLCMVSFMTSAPGLAWAGDEVRAAQCDTDGYAQREAASPDAQDFVGGRAASLEDPLIIVLAVIGLLVLIIIIAAAAS